MSLRLEAFLAKIYVNAEARVKFLANPQKEAADAGLTPEEVNSIERMDRTGLQMTANSLARKRHVRRDGLR